MKKFGLFFIFFCFSGIIILPFLIKNDYYSSISVIADMIGGLSSFITLIIAILLYNKFEMDKILLEKQTEAVLNLFKEIKKTTLLINDNKKFFLRMHLNSKSFSSFDKFKDKELLFSMNYLKKLENVFKL